MGLGIRKSLTGTRPGTSPNCKSLIVRILATILESVGIHSAGIALILGVDRLLDMSRTMVNVTGGLTACCFFIKQMNHIFDKQPLLPNES